MSSWQLCVTSQGTKRTLTMDDTWVLLFFFFFDLSWSRVYSLGPRSSMHVILQRLTVLCVIVLTIMVVVVENVFGDAWVT